MTFRYAAFSAFVAGFWAVSSGVGHAGERAAAHERAPLVLAVGEQRLLGVPGLLKFSLGGPCVRALSVPRALAPEGDALLLKGASAGATDLVIWKSDGSEEHRTVRVEKVDPEQVSSALEKALAPLSEAEVVFAGPGAVIRGTISSVEEAGRIEGIVAAFPKEVRDETEPSDALVASGRERLEAWLKLSAYPAKLRIERLGRDLWVRGHLERPADRATVERRARAAYPLVQLELEALPDSSPTVHFKVFLLELKRSRFGTFGLQWPGSLEGAFHVSPGAITDSLSLDVALQALEGDGSVKVLSNPELVVRAPGEAELFAGGELPIHMESHFYSEISWKSYGLTLKLHVTASTPELVRLDIMTEVSRLDPTVTSDNKIPSIQANRMKTQVDARFGAPLLLSGLLQEGTREQARGLPLLRSLPILGALFGSEDYLNERSELVAILLPNHTPPPAPMNRVEHVLPKGALPPPRDWVSAADEKALKASPDYPWNVLKSRGGGPL
jgi:Flp pilus assembly secretin CpaC